MDKERAAFLRGYACAIATLNREYDQPTMCLDVLRAAASYKGFKAAGTDSYDLSEIRKIFKEGEREAGDE